MPESTLDQEMRESFAEDAGAFLWRMEAAATLLLEAQSLAPKALAELTTARPFQEIDDGAQSIRGSAASIGVDFLADAASCVEELSRRGNAALVLAAAHAARAHSMATFCADALREMRGMLNLFVEEAPEEASWLAMVLKERATEATKLDDKALADLGGAPLGTAGGTSAESPSAEPDSDAPVAVRVASRSAPEFAFDEKTALEEGEEPLARVFQAEAREVILALRGHVDAFLSTRAQPTLAKVEPLLHTLKGSSAAVELPYLSTCAAETLSLLAKVQAVPPADDDIEAFVASTNRLLATLTIAPIDYPAQAAERRGSRPPDTDAVFFAEAERLIETATTTAEALSKARSKAVSTSLSEEAERLFHALKGTAAVAGATALSEEADALMNATKNVTDPVVLASTIAEGCVRLTDILHGRQRRPSVPTTGPLRKSTFGLSEAPKLASDGLLAIFQQEMAELLPQLKAALLQLDPASFDRPSLEALYRIFHTLKGTASAVGHRSIGGAAALLEDAVEKVLEGPEGPIGVAFVDRMMSESRILLGMLGFDPNVLEEEIVELPSGDLVEDEAAAEGDVPTQAKTREASKPPARFSELPGELEPGVGDWDTLLVGVKRALARAHNATAETEGMSGELGAVFVEEVEILAKNVVENLTGLEKNPRDLDRLGTLERLLHTLKGSAATVERKTLSAAANALRAMLEACSKDIELDAARVVELRETVMSLLEIARRAGKGVPVAGSSTAEFSFDESEEQEVESALPDDELLKIFQQEARESLIALQGHLETLIETPNSVYAAEFIERLFHTLKGAAATVGLSDVAALAASLQGMMEEMLAGGREASPQFIQDLVGRTNELLNGIGVPPIELPDPRDPRGASVHPSGGTSATSHADGVARRIFLDEVKEICRAASAHTRTLLQANDAAATTKLRAEIGDLFHRLKGTAATVGVIAIAEEAERATAAARGKGSPGELAQQVRHAIVRIAELAGFERVEGRATKKDKKSKDVRETVELPEERELWLALNQECTELLDQIEKAAFSLDEVSQPKPVIEEIFRHVHTLKGAVNTVGLSPTGKMLHAAEDFLEKLGAATILPPMRNVADVIAEVVNVVRQNLRTAPNGWVETSLGGLMIRIQNVMAPPALDLDSRDKSEKSGSLQSGALNSFDSAAIFGTGGRSSGAGASNGSAADSHSSSRSGDREEERAYIRVATTRLDALMNLAGELVVSRSRLSSRIGTLRSLYGELGRGRARLAENVEAFRGQYEFASLGGEGARRAKRTPTVAAAEEVAGAAAAAGGPVFGALELDEYEDVQVLSRSLAEIGNDFEEAFRSVAKELGSFADDADSLGGIISGIQGEVTRARMVPLDAVFGRLRFPVRDAATRDGKEVRVVTEGADVTIDKTIADAILQPMLHLVRNAVAHGIETPDRRAAARKDRMGVVRLSARQASGQIVIEVIDDGAGLDLAALRARGISLGLVPSDVGVNDPRVKDLVFAPSLSTRMRAGDVAGRGVGGDIAKRTIERLNGAIRVESVRGKGTTFTITLPLTLAIMRALLVKEGDETYAVPLYSAEHIHDADTLSIAEARDERRVLLDGAFTRIRRLADYFEGEANTTGKGPALVLRVGDERVVLQVDSVVGEEEIVVKKTGAILEGHPLFAGVTLRGSGDLVLILDVPGLIEQTGRSVRATDDVAGHPQAAQEVVEALAEQPEEDAAAPAEAKGKAKAKAKAKTKERKPAVAGETGPLHGVRALVVDDSLSVRKVAESQLRGLGVEVVLAVDGIDGVSKLREQQFDIVFTDLEMPRMHGYDFVRQIRVLAAYQSLPVVIVSSRSGQKHQDLARSVGATDYVTKPFSAQSLEATIRKWVKG